MFMYVTYFYAVWYTFVTCIQSYCNYDIVIVKKSYTTDEWNTKESRTKPNAAN